MSTNVEYYKENTIGKDYVVGDLHGCFHDLQDMLKVINFNKDTDRLFSVGDLVDRGPDSLKTLGLLNESWFFAVKGNHEDLMVKSILKLTDERLRIFESWMYNGGGWYPLLSNQEKEDMLPLVKKAQNLPLAIVVGKDSPNRFNIVHAELNHTSNNYDKITDKSLDEWDIASYKESDIFWGRTLWEASRVLDVDKARKGLSRTFCGHTPVKNNLVVNNHIYLDSGACFYYNSSLPENNNSFLTVFDIKQNRYLKLNLFSREVKRIDFE